MTSSVHQAREALGHRLRDIRRDAALTGRQLGRQQTSRTLEEQTRLMRWYEPLLIPGILHTAEYATAVMRRVIDFYEIPDDLDAGVAARMERQHILYRGDHVTLGQLDRLLAVMSLPRVTLGIIPAHAGYRVLTNQFIMYDNRLIHVETISAELTISQPREIALYSKAFHELTRQAVRGQTARTLITTALDDLRNGQSPAPDSNQPAQP
ncbi:MAG: DUF5753 domain-containing protein [Pseudonocardiaceae bacterium]